VDLVKTFYARIDELNLKGPILRTVIETWPLALQTVDEGNTLRKKGIVFAPLPVIQILLTDSITTRLKDKMNTSAFYPQRDACGLSTVVLCVQANETILGESGCKCYIHSTSTHSHPHSDYIVSQLNTIFKKLGAIIIDPTDLVDVDKIAASENKLIILSFELKDGINRYLKSSRVFLPRKESCKAQSTITTPA